MRGLYSLLALAAAGRVACLTPDDPSIPIPTPKAHLTWGDVNVLHTTDIHGWMLGHPKKVYPELSWSGTFGDFYSFVTHMRAAAQRKQVDLFLVDTGDRRIGHGLTDKVLVPGSINGQLVNQMYLDVDYDVIVPGNHDLSTKDAVEYVMTSYADKWKGKYLTSNVRRVNPEKVHPSSTEKQDDREFLGAPYRYWKSDNKNKVLAFGVILHAERKGDTQIAITPVEKMVEESWFKGALELPTDVYLIAGHVDAQEPESYDNMRLIHDAIRKKHPGKPILMFGGHSHKRYCERYRFGEDGGLRSMIIQSGRYFDTVGWMSMKFDNNDPKENLKMTRRYLDNNVQTYMYHTNMTSVDDFHTKEGQAMTNTAFGIDRAEGLSQVYGYLEKNYYLDRKDWTESDADGESLFKFYLDAVQNVLIREDQKRDWMFFSNWGIVRADIYSGPFTLGDFYSITPNARDASNYLTIPVPRNLVDRFVDATRNDRVPKNNSSKIVSHNIRLSHSQGVSEVLPPTGDIHQTQLATNEPEQPQEPENLTWGWKTVDQCGEPGRLPGNDLTDSNGDDVDHKNIPHVTLDRSGGNPERFFWRKSWAGKTNVPLDDMVDVIFPNYVGRKNVPTALKELNITGKTSVYNEKITQDLLLGLYVRKYFNTITSNVPFPQ